MCEISVVNLKDSLLNRKLFLLMGFLGSGIHKDGWGLGTGDGTSWKCSLAMQLTSDAGKVLAKYGKKSKGPFLGHIRQASTKIPVTIENSHPFTMEDIVFVHNGKLTPKVEKNFEMEVEVPDLDKDSKEQVDKDGNRKMKKIPRSDSLVFFEKFVEYFTTYERKDKESDDEFFVRVLNSTMELFTGKFAFVFIINGKFYVVRGKTADLHISYLLDSGKKDANTIGWAVNTSKIRLDDSLLLLSNLQQLDGQPPLHFTYPTILKEETIFRADSLELEPIGEIKENTSYTQAYKTRAETSAGNFSHYGGAITQKTGGARGMTEIDKLYKEVYEFQRSYSLSLSDMQNIFDACYYASLLEATESLLKNFCREILPKMRKKTTKEIRKRVKHATSGLHVASYHYDKEFKYPWFLNSPEMQLKFVEKLEQKDNV
jgi:hypothetical protein